MEIKNHEIIHEINRGPITTVYKARHLGLDRLVLLKVLNTQWLNEKDLLKRFKREAQISARLEHPNIVKVYDFAVSPRLVYISLEYIEGSSLDTYIKRYHPIDIDIICQFIIEILSAIQFAHSNNIIHRDIKPSNILIDRNNKAYLTDFGLAAIPENDKITQQGHITGTPAYLAPERVKGQPAGKASDLYSLGLTFYELLTAKSPFQKENTAATLQSILTDNPPDVNDDRLPGWLISLVRILLSRDPIEREDYINVLPENFQPLEKNNISLRAKSPIGTATWIYSFILLSIVILSVYWISSIGPVETDEPQTRDMDSVGITERIEEALPGGGISVPGSDTVFTQTNKPIEHFVKPDLISTPPDSQISENTLANSGFFITCTPWATVFINGDSLDTTPMQVPLMLKPGQYQLVLKNPNYQDILKMVEVKENTIDTLNFKLKETYGYLFIQVTPWAKIYINKEYKEETPLLNPIVVQAGENIIELVNPQYQTIYDTLFIAAGKRIQKQYSFKD